MKRGVFVVLILGVFLVNAYDSDLDISPVDVRLIGCTEEAKICPDGSGVVRNASNNCEFDLCPVRYCENSVECVTVKSLDCCSCDESINFEYKEEWGQLKTESNRECEELFEQGIVCEACPESVGAVCENYECRVLLAE